MTADQVVKAKHAAHPHISEETHAYYWGRNAAWAAIAEGKNKIENPFKRNDMRSGFFRGVKHAMAEEHLSLDIEWD
jgi:predicted transcriptional regulator